MFKNRILSVVFIVAIALSIGALRSVSFSAEPTSAIQAAGDKQKKDKQDKAKSDSGKEKKTLVDPSEGHPVLWKEPANISSLDLFYGPGGAKGAPNLSDKFTFEERDTNGTQLKIYVKDSEGRDWTVKFGPEARPETAATRIVWAMGYHADEDYFVKSVHIDGWKGTATNVRFKRRHNGFKDVGLWTWESNPFNGTRELDGLKVLMALLNNWDLKYDNNKVLKPDKKSGADPDERIYYVGDLGASFAKTGSLARKLHFPGDPPAGTKDRPDQYAHQAFVTRVDNGAVHFHYQGKDHAALQGIPVKNARWMGMMLGRLSDKQISDAFRASGYSDSEIAMLVRAMHERIAELQNLK